MRISGFASGFDTDAMVKQLMKAHQVPVLKLKHQTTKIEWQQEAYRSISTSLVDFRNNKLHTYGLTNSIDAKKAEVSGNTSAISATTNGQSVSGVMTVNVTQLASAASVTFNTGIPGEAPGASTNYPGTALEDIPGWNSTDEFIEINGKKIEYDKRVDTIQSLVIRINGNKEANATAIYDAATGQLSISSKTTGAGTITLGGDFYGVTATSIQGKDAIATVNGLVMTSSTNQLTVNGTTIALKQLSGANGPSTVTVNSNADKILETIKSFITDYNKVVEQINGKLGEERYRDFKPLSDEEQQAMTDKQAEIWESKARSGLLRRDDILTQTVSNLRTAATSGFGDPQDKFNIQSIGISTGKWYEGGKLVIENEQKLREAIEADPEKIMQLFTAKSTAEPATGHSKASNPETGIFTRMSDILMDSLKQLSEKAGTSQTSSATTGIFLETSLLGIQKRDLNTRLADMNRRLSMMETQYYKQFTAMETAINRYNSQSGSLSGLMNG